MKALVTRPAEDAEALAARLRARGIEPVIEPLLTIRFAADGAKRLAPALAAAQAVLFTSANGVRALAAATPRRDLAVFAVGDATAAAVRAAGFGSVESAGGTVADLARLVARRLRPGSGPLVHAAGAAVAGDLAGALGAAGFTLHRAVLYDAVPASRLSRGTVDLMAHGRIALALFFSPRTAASFVRLAAAAELAGACRAMTAIALSPAVAASLAGLEWGAIGVAPSPNETALLAALERAAGVPAAGSGNEQDASA